MPSSANLSSHQDGNQQFTLIAVQGTLGTADVVGTAKTIPVGATDQGAIYVHDLSGTGGTTNIQGSVQVTGGSIVVTEGTIGTVSNVGKVHNAGTIAGGTLGILTDGTIRVAAGTIQNGTIRVTAGTINSVTTVTNLTNGTIQNSGTTTGVGTVSNVAVIHNAGTIQNGTLSVLSNLTNGSINVTAGTVAVTTPGTITSGSITIIAGTIGTVASIAQVHNAGTLQAGTITTQPYPASQVQSASFIGTGAVGTLVSAIGAGTGIYINSIILTAMSGTLDMCLSFALGSTTNQVVQRGLYVPGGGVALSFDNPSFYGTANSALTYQILGGAGTASWQVTYNSKGTP